MKTTSIKTTQFAIAILKLLVLSCLILVLAGCKENKGEVAYGPSSVSTANINGTTYIFTTGFLQNKVNVFKVENDGSLENVYSLQDDSTLNLNAAQYAHPANVNDSHYLFVTGFADNGVSVFNINDNGSLENVYNLRDNASLQLQGAYFSSTVSIGEITYLFVCGFFDNGISSFRVNNDGSLVNIQNLEDNLSLEINAPRQLSTATIGEVPYLFAAGFLDDGH